MKIVFIVVVGVFILILVSIYISSPKRDERHAKDRYKTTRQVRNNQELLKKK